MYAKQDEDDERGDTCEDGGAADDSEGAKTSTSSVSQQASTVLSTSMVIPGQIEARTQTEHEIWLRAADGRERGAVPFVSGRTLKTTSPSPSSSQ